MKQQKNENTNKGILRIIPLGGLGEVGANMMVYEYDNQIMVVDTGLMFPENDMLGIDYIIPDISYLVARKNHVRHCYNPWSRRPYRCHSARPCGDQCPDLCHTPNTRVIGSKTRQKKCVFC